MKHIFRNVSIFLFRVTGIVFLYRRIRRQAGPLVRVVAFHDVTDSHWFENIIEMLAEEFNVITPEEFHNEIFDPKRINILVTFDDGYKSWIDICVPILSKYNIKALFFINSGLLNVAEDPALLSKYVQNNLKLSPKIPLTWSGARALIASGHCIGGHTVHHKSLKQLPTEEVRAEVLDDKRTIEEELQSKIYDFAYPFGVLRDYSEETEKCIRLCGYADVYIAEPGFVTKAETHVPRTLIEKGQSPRSVYEWVEGGYDVFVALKRNFRI